MDGQTMAALARTVQFARELVFMPGAATDERIAGALLGTSVAIVADEGNVRSAAAQSAVTALARLTLGYGASLRLVFPEVPMAGTQPPLRGNALRAALVDLGGDLVPGTSAAADDRAADGDLVFVLGDTPWHGDVKAAWRVIADEWSGGITSPLNPAPRIVSRAPMGALVAAVVAAAEPFKQAMRAVVAPVRGDEALAPAGHAIVRLGPERTSLVDIDLGSLDCISGGAIVNGALFCLLRVPGVRGRVRILEPEHGDLSNLNRYSLMRRSRVNLPKIAMLREWSQPEFGLTGEEVMVTDDTIARVRPLARRVLVGTDAVRPRWQIQREWPTQLVVGSTADWSAIVSEHRREGPCIGCVNFEDEPALTDIPTVSFVSFWAGLIAAARLLRDAAGHPHPQSEQLTEVLGPLRLDGASGFRTRAIRRHPRCPVGCDAGTLALA